MPYLIGLLITLVSIALLARPILRRVQTTSGSSSLLDSQGDSRGDGVQWQRQQVYDEIKTLILDYELGNIPPEEYNEKLGTYRLQAASLLRQQELLLHESRYLVDEMEDEVLALRISWGTVKEVTTCGECGGERDLNAALCPRCEFQSEDGGSPITTSPSEEETS
ncbi:MAG: hypothetical protein O2783_08100 [Chloroflexi bacterium]|nr:hypothetical protein [Chloroflexota bacterium]